MADTLSKRERSQRMARIRSRDTRPEFLVRRLVHRLGYRFRVYRPDLPGRPDLVLPRHHAIIFVHGCFWHRHSGCPRARLPASNIKYWLPKLTANKQRDKKHATSLVKLGWRVLVLWERELVDVESVAHKIVRFLSAPSKKMLF
jgi:DNA mismatch endonuclease (patch repair protein)